MAEEYRDSLEAAHARIAELERENAALKSASVRRPATAAEVEVLRLEQEIFRLDLDWKESPERRTAGGGPEAAARNRTILRRMAAVSMLLGIVFALVIYGAAPSNAGWGAAVVWGVFAGVGALSWLMSVTMMTNFERAWVRYASKRAALERAIAEAREPGAATTARLRVAEEPGDVGADEVEAAASSLRARS